MLFYDFEVFKHDWMVVIVDSDTRIQHDFINDVEGFIDFYNKNKSQIWVGYNSRHYDQYIAKSIICGFKPQEINDWIINKKEPGWEFFKGFHRVQFYNFDIMTNKFHSLKQLEGFQGHDIRETSVPFDIDRKLTEKEIIEVMGYCSHDVYETIHIFIERKDEFQSQMELLKMFNMPLKYISKTKVQLSAMILEASPPKKARDDEFNISFPPTMKIAKYRNVLEFYQTTRDYEQTLVAMIANIEHTFAWGGLHGAIPNYQGEGYYLMIDVESYYPALMIEYNYGSRNVSDPNKFRAIRDTRVKYKLVKDSRQAPLKIVINGTYGAMKDQYNALYDPLMANNVCVGGMLLLLDLIEKLEPYCTLIQSNTDGILVKLNSPNDYELIDDICYEWESRTRMKLEFEEFKKVIQKDVNNYILVPTGPLYDEKGKARWKSKGSYVKQLNSLDNDLPIVNEAIVNYFVKGIPVEKTIRECHDLIKFQKIVKISGKYSHLRYGTKKMNERVLRVFASNDTNDNTIKKIKDGNPEKIPYVAAHCFIDNSNVIGKKVPNKLNKKWYVDLAKDRINSFLGGE